MEPHKLHLRTIYKQMGLPKQIGIQESVLEVSLEYPEYWLQTLDVCRP